jgi:hypothetical protein
MPQKTAFYMPELAAVDFHCYTNHFCTAGFHKTARFDANGWGKRLVSACILVGFDVA